MQRVVAALALLGLIVALASCVPGGVSVPPTSTLAVVDLSEAVALGDLELVKRLLDDGTDPDRPAVHGLTPLMRAANRDDVAVARALIDAGATVDLADSSRTTALHIAARADAVETLRMLLERGADPASRSAAGMNALDHAADAGSVAVLETLVTQTGLDIDEPSEATTQGHGHPRDAGPTPLGLAVRAGRVDTVEELLRLGAEVDGMTASGHTPLLLAIFSDQPAVIVEVLRDAGASVEARARCDLGCSVGDGRALTVVEWAVELERTALIPLLGP